MTVPIPNVFRKHSLYFYYCCKFEISIHVLNISFSDSLTLVKKSRGKLVGRIKSVSSRREMANFRQKQFTLQLFYFWNCFYMFLHKKYRYTDIEGQLIWLSHLLFVALLHNKAVQQRGGKVILCLSNWIKLSKIDDARSSTHYIDTKLNRLLYI